MITEKKFCKKCGQLIKEPLLFLSPKTYYEFEDGYYCMECARDKVKKSRGKK